MLYISFFAVFLCSKTINKQNTKKKNLTMQQCSKRLRGFMIENIGAAILSISLKGKSINAKFNIVEAPGSPSMLGCPQYQELGIITANVDEVNTSLSTGNQPKNTPETETGVQHGQLSKSTVLEEYPDCFNKLGRFRGEKYHIHLVDNPDPVVCPRAPFQFTYFHYTRRNLIR